MNLCLEFTTHWTQSRRNNVDKKMNKWIHVLKPWNEEGDKWQGQLHAIKLQMHQNKKTMEDRFTKIDAVLSILMKKR